MQTYNLVSCLLESLSRRKGACDRTLGPGPGLALLTRDALLALAFVGVLAGLLELPAALERC